MARTVEIAEKRSATTPKKMATDCKTSPIEAGEQPSQFWRDPANFCEEGVAPVSSSDLDACIEKEDSNVDPDNWTGQCGQGAALRGARCQSFLCAHLPLPSPEEYNQADEHLQRGNKHVPPSPGQAQAEQRSQQDGADGGTQPKAGVQPIHQPWAADTHGKKFIPAAIDGATADTKEKGSGDQQRPVRGQGNAQQANAAHNAADYQQSGDAEPSDQASAVKTGQQKARCCDKQHGPHLSVLELELLHHRGPGHAQHPIWEAQHDEDDVGCRHQRGRGQKVDRRVFSHRVYGFWVVTMP